MNIRINKKEFDFIIECLKSYLTSGDRTIFLENLKNKLIEQKKYVDNCNETKKDLLKKLIEIQGVFLNNEKVFEK